MSNLEEASAEIRKYVIWHYGNLISIEEPSFDEERKIWEAQLKANYPRLIKNEYPQEQRFIRILPMKQLGTIYFSQQMQFLKDRSTSREECLNIVRSYLQMWRERAESIIVQASALQLAKTSPARVFLNPINVILANFMQKEETVISFEDIEKLRKRVMRWILLLEELNLVKKVEYGYTYGDMFTALRKEAKSDREFETFVMSYVIQKRYPLLKEVFRIQQFETLVHLDSCYYRPALEAETVLYQRAESLFRRFTENYRPRPYIELRHILHELRDSDALHTKGDYYLANEELFNKMIEAKKTELPELSFPRT